MNNFITNDEAKDLKRRLIEFIKKSDELKFLVENSGDSYYNSLF